MNILDRLQDAPYGAYAIDQSQTIVFWNTEATRILGHEARKVIGRKCYEVVKSLPLYGDRPICIENCPAIVAANHGRIPPVSHVRMLCASERRKQVTVIPLITTDQDDRLILIHMFHETPVDGSTANESASLPLTPRELEVLSLLALGIRPTEVAEQLFISVHTVRTHIRNASEKLHVHGTMAAVLAAQRQHFL